MLADIWLSMRSGQPVFLVGAFGGAAGLPGLNPLLDEAEPQALFDAIDPMRITELILRGLDRLAQR